MCLAIVLFLGFSQKSFGNWRCFHCKNIGFCSMHDSFNCWGLKDMIDRIRYLSIIHFYNIDCTIDSFPQAPWINLRKIYVRFKTLILFITPIQFPIQHPVNRRKFNSDSVSWSEKETLTCLSKPVVWADWRWPWLLGAGGPPAGPCQVISGWASARTTFKAADRSHDSGHKVVFKANIRDRRWERNRRQLAAGGG